MTAFDHARRRLRRADHHIRDFVQATQNFVNANVAANRIFAEPHPHKDNRRLIKFRMIGPLPEDAENFAVDAVAGLRAALDYLAYASAVSLGAVTPKSAYFPFADDETALENTIKGRCKDLPPSVVSLFRDLEPFKTGNGNDLWELNKLRNRAEHASILTAAFDAGETIVDVPFGVNPFSVISSGFQWDLSNHEFTIAEVGPERADIRYRYQFTLRVFFADTPTSGMVPAGDFLEKLSGKISKVIDAVEAETLRLSQANL